MTNPGKASGRVCIDCGYALDALTREACPECGRAFDLTEPRSTISARRYPWLRLARPPGLFFLGITAIWSLLAIWAESLPGGDLFPVILANAFGILLVVIYFVRASTTMFITRVWLGWRLKNYKRTALLWAKPWVMVVFVVCLNGTRIPEGIRFGASLSAMNRVDAEVEAAPAGTLFADRPIGLYSAHRIEKIPGGMRFAVNRADIAFVTGPSHGGFAHLPNGPQDTPSRVVNYRHYRGNWYLYEAW